MRAAAVLIGLCGLLLLAACSTAPVRAPVPRVARVDLQRYLGSWYVIASIPTRWERDGYDQVETYRLAPDGRICTRFQYRRGAFDGPLKTIRSTARVLPGRGNAEWSVHFFWLLRTQYVIAWLAPDDSRVIVARDARDYVWLMARTPQISAADYEAMRAQVGAMGYPLDRLHEVPQRWPAGQGAARLADPVCD